MGDLFDDLYDIVRGTHIDLMDMGGHIERQKVEATRAETLAIRQSTVHRAASYICETMNSG